MLEYLELEIGGYPGYQKINIMLRNNQVCANIESIPTPPFLLHNSLNERESQKWLDDLEALNIPKWNTNYETDESIIICDGESWSLDYKIKDKRCRHFKGYMLYPENWKDLAGIERSVDNE